MFWARLIDLCREKGVAPAEVARAIGLSNATMTHWKQGVVPSAENTARVAKYLGVTTDYLLGESDVGGAGDDGSFIKRFYGLCDEKGVSASFAAVSVGFSSSIVTCWKKGKRPRGDNAAKLARYFGVSTDYLLGLSDERGGATQEAERATEPLNTDEEAVRELRFALFDGAKDLNAEQLRDLIGYLEWKKKQG